MELLGYFKACLDREGPVSACLQILIKCLANVELLLSKFLHLKIPLISSGEHVLSPLRLLSIRKLLSEFGSECWLYIMSEPSACLTAFTLYSTFCLYFY